MKYYNPFTLEGKTILISGASSGIGRATAIECSNMGAEVILLGRNKEELNRTYNQLRNKRKHSMIVSDITNYEQVNIWLQELPVLDGVVNNAGVINTIPFKFIQIDEMKGLYDVNLFSHVYINQQLVEKKILGKDSSVVFVSSIDGPITAHYGNTMYSSSKGALTAVAKGMALELATKKIRVNSVLPGMVSTPLIGNDSFSNDQLVEDLKLYPLKRYGKPEEVAYAIIYLLSDASAWVTGSNLIIDGGYTLL
jgi:NAD(P)-dependent dehydrogenase (short-subunit alcohol dehydrogenase family)